MNNLSDELVVSVGPLGDSNWYTTPHQRSRLILDKQKN